MTEWNQSESRLMVTETGSRLVLTAPTCHKSYLAFVLGFVFLAVATFFATLPIMKLQAGQLTGILLFLLSGTMGWSALSWWKAHEWLVVDINSISHGLDENASKEASIPLEEVKEIGLKKPCYSALSYLWIQGHASHIVFGRSLRLEELEEAMELVVKWRWGPA